MERSGQKIGWGGAERGAGVAKNDGAGAKAGGRENGAGSGLNRPLQGNSETLLSKTT